MTISDAIAQLDAILVDLAELRTQLERRRSVLPSVVSEEGLKTIGTVEFDVQLYKNQMVISQDKDELNDDDDAGRLRLPRGLDASTAVRNCRNLYDLVVKLLNEW